MDEKVEETWARPVICGLTTGANAGQSSNVHEEEMQLSMYRFRRAGTLSGGGELRSQAAGQGAQSMQQACLLPVLIAALRCRESGCQKTDYLRQQEEAVCCDGADRGAACDISR